MTAASAASSASSTPSVLDLLGAAARRGAGAYGDAPLGPEIRFDFDAGLPDPSTYPVDDLVRIADRVLRADPAAALHYGRHEILHGYRPLREVLAAPLGREPREVMLTSGGAQAISLACQAVTEPGDVVAVEVPTWGYMLREVELAGARALAVRTDEHGLVVDELAAHAARIRRDGGRLSAVYVIPNFAVPTGVCLSSERRLALVELAQRERFVIIEDDTYGRLRYEGDDLPSLASLDDQGVVVKIDSFSKVIAPGLRLGWATGDASLIAGMAAVRRDLGVSQWTARIVHTFLVDGLFEPHLARVRALYRRKVDVADAALARHGGGLVRWRRPDGGFFLWLELPHDVDSSALMVAAAARGVACRPGERFFGQPDEGRHHVRLAFSMYPEAALQEGIAAFCDAVARR
jgi:2-aminoadipate transaminase